MNEWMPVVITVVVSVIVLLFLVLYIGLNKYTSLFIVVWSVLIVMLSIVGYRIWKYTESIGRRLGFLAVVLLVVFLPITTFKSFALTALMSSVAIVILVMLAIALAPKDIIATLCLVPVLLYLIMSLDVSYSLAKLE